MIKTPFGYILDDDNSPEAKRIRELGLEFNEEKLKDEIELEMNEPKLDKPVPPRSVKKKNKVNKQKKPSPME